MMAKRILLLLVSLLLFVTFASKVVAQAPVEIYVDLSAAGNEDGTKDHPYNKQAEGVAYLQAQPYGGDLFVRQADGTWGQAIPIKGVKPGTPGTPLPAETLYLLLAVLALILILAGWSLMRRSRQLQV